VSIQTPHQFHCTVAEKGIARLDWVRVDNGETMHSADDVEFVTLT